MSLPGILTQIAVGIYTVGMVAALLYVVCEAMSGGDKKSKS